MSTYDGDASPLVGTTWVLTTLGDERALDGVSVTLRFGSDGALRGRDGCNRFRGTFTERGDGLTLRMGSSTLMACPEPVMRQAQVFAKALSSTASGTVADGMLTLHDERGQVVATMTLRSPQSLTDTGWTATGVNNGQGGVTSLVIGSEITARFGEDGQVTGNAGINTYGARYTVDGASISFGPARTTRMAGDPQVMEQESQYLQALGRVTRFTIDDEGRLELRDDGNALQVSFVAAAPSDDDTAPDAERPGSAVLDGTVTYRARVALPDDAVVTVSLQDTSKMDVAAVELAAQTITTEGRQVPIPFSLSYDPGAIDERMTYSVRAEITVGGTLAWTTTTHTPVLTRGAPSSAVEVRVEQVASSRP